MPSVVDEFVRKGKERFMNLFNINDEQVLIHLMNVADGREELTSEEQRNVASRLLDLVEDGVLGDQETLIAARNADGRHPIG